MKYRPSEYRYAGSGKYYYITYKHLETLRNGKRAYKPRAKRVFISGKLLSHKLGTWKNRYGKRIYGIKFEYENTRVGYHRRGFSAQRGRTKYKVSPARVGKARMTVTKIVTMPHNIKTVKITTKRPEPTLPNVR